MKEQFVTYEIALKLKELGFDEQCLMYFDKEELNYCPHWFNNSSLIPNGDISAPLWQQVIDWFREKHDITIDIAKIYNGTDNYHFALNLEWEYFEGTYYEAREQAILKAIELCQKK